ncbi:MAG: hypothetical protein A3H79_03985 [Candidatus Levybacteria bacterium RIFCSPLOWO2_02_FULL_36_8b]|nr:MAG: hypothetical protein A3H79_03985 [Candidatus Levybacteria bacterium RIFCSPLOWO2_02_FULL_36_8b]
MDILGTIAEKIIQEQEKIIGPIALEQARKVQGLNVDMQKHEVKFTGNEKEILENLVGQYQHLFGRASVEVCREAVKGIISDAPKEKIPSLLF